MSVCLYGFFVLCLQWQDFLRHGQVIFMCVCVCIVLYGAYNYYGLVLHVLLSSKLSAPARRANVVFHNDYSHSVVLVFPTAGFTGGGRPGHS